MDLVVMEEQKKGLHICGLVAGQPGAAKMVDTALNARSALYLLCSWSITLYITYLLL